MREKKLLNYLGEFILLHVIHAFSSSVPNYCPEQFQII